MQALEVVAGIVAALGYVVALFSVEGRLEAMRRPGASPVPGWNWGRFAYLTDPANLRPGAERLITWYQVLWFAPLAAFVVVAIGFCRARA